MGDKKVSGNHSYEKNRPAGLCSPTPQAFATSCFSWFLLFQTARTIWRENVPGFRNTNTVRALRACVGRRNMNVSKTWMGKRHISTLQEPSEASGEGWDSSNLKKSPKGGVGARSWSARLASWVHWGRSEATKTGNVDRKCGGHDSVRHPLSQLLLFRQPGFKHIHWESRQGSSSLSE